MRRPLQRPTRLLPVRSLLAHVSVQTVHGRQMLSVQMPSRFDSARVAKVSVRSRGAAYASEQRVIQYRIRQQQAMKEREAAAAAAAGGAMPGAAASAAASAPVQQLDSKEVFQQKWRPLRDEAMAELHTALLAMLWQAVRYRGRLAFPLAPAAGESGPAAGQQAGPA